MAKKQYNKSCFKRFFTLETNYSLKAELRHKIMTIKKTHKIHGIIQVHQPFIAALFDKKNFEKKAPPQFNDLNLIAYLLHGLYSHKEKSSEIKSLLLEVAEYLNKSAIELNALKEIIDDEFNKLSEIDKLPSSPLLNFDCEITWDNQIYLTMVSFIKQADQVAIKINVLKDREAITKTDYYKYLKEGTRPIRGLYIFIAQQAKKANAILAPS